MQPPIPEHRSADRIGILLVNLGTPDAPQAGAIRRYLRSFLWDPRVVEIPRALWWMILNLVILPLRPRKLVHSYASIWTPQGSPLLAIGRNLQQALQQRLGESAAVELAMRYGSPGIDTGIAALRERGANKLLVLPLYPQYSATTTASVFDAVYAVLREQRWPPELRTINSYHDRPDYIDALAASVRRHWDTHGRGDLLMMSFHSIPLRCLELGDPYYCHCRKTARLLAEALSLGPEQYRISFQSRVGRAKWLQPYTDKTVVELAHDGVRTLDVICPGFAADCLETLEEIALRYAQDFKQAGGQQLRYIPALNDQAAHVDALLSLVQQYLQGWGDNAPSATDAAFRDAQAAAAVPVLYA